MPGVRFAPDQKLALALKIDEFGAKVIENMPVVSKEEEEVTKQLVSLGLKAEIRALARLRKGDVDCAASCGVKRILLVSPVSDIHLQYKLRWSREQNIENALELIDYCHSYGMSVDYAAEDSSRADKGYLFEFMKTVENEIDFFLVGDTLGCLTPERSFSLFSELKKSAKCKLEAHHHNDFGLATASTLAAIAGGADAFSGTFCGIGERAGNAPIEEVCLALKFLHGQDVSFDFSLVHQIGQMVREYSGIPLSPHKPWVGDNAFTHESGIHVASVLRNPLTYEFLPPELIGQKRKLVYGKHSGNRLKVLGEAHV
jgi:isopropylmalate/homocitrate/citramalate synthase